MSIALSITSLVSFGFVTAWIATVSEYSLTTSFCDEQQQILRCRITLWWRDKPPDKHSQENLHDNHKMALLNWYRQSWCLKQVNKQREFIISNAIINLISSILEPKTSNRQFDIVSIYRGCFLLKLTKKQPLGSAPGQFQIKFLLDTPVFIWGIAA